MIFNNCIESSGKPGQCVPERDKIPSGVLFQQLEAGTGWRNFKYRETEPKMELKLVVKESTK
jgi:hypothetical protein